MSKKWLGRLIISVLVSIAVSVIIGGFVFHNTLYIAIDFFPVMCIQLLVYIIEDIIMDASASDER